MFKRRKASTGSVGSDSISKHLLAYKYDPSVLKDSLLVDPNGKPIQIPKQEPQILLLGDRTSDKPDRKNWEDIDSVGIPDDIKTIIREGVLLWINDYEKAYREQHEKLAVRRITKNDVRPHESKLRKQEGLFSLGDRKRGEVVGFLSGAPISKAQEEKLVSSDKTSLFVGSVKTDSKDRGILLLLSMLKKCNTRLTEELERDDFHNNLGEGVAFVKINLDQNPPRTIPLRFLWAKRDLSKEQLCYEYGPLDAVRKIHPQEYQDMYSARMEAKKTQALQDTTKGISKALVSQARTPRDEQPTIDDADLITSAFIQPPKQRSVPAVPPQTGSQPAARSARLQKSIHAAPKSAQSDDQSSSRRLKILEAARNTWRRVTRRSR